jgi:hypothetical protein
MYLSGLAGRVILISLFFFVVLPKFEALKIFNVKFRGSLFLCALVFVSVLVKNFLMVGVVSQFIKDFELVKFFISLLLR